MFYKLKFNVKIDSFKDHYLEWIECYIICKQFLAHDCLIKCYFLYLINYINFGFKIIKIILNFYCVI